MSTAQKRDRPSAPERCNDLSTNLEQWGNPAICSIRDRGIGHSHLPAASIIGGLSSVAAAAPAPLTIAFITSETGPAATQDLGVVAVLKAALEAQNAKSGVKGHKLVPLVIDDQTRPATLSTGVQEAISKGSIGIAAESSLLCLVDQTRTERRRSGRKEPRVWGLLPGDHFGGAFVVGTSMGHVSSHVIHLFDWVAIERRQGDLCLSMADDWVSGARTTHTRNGEGRSATDDDSDAV